MASQNVHGNEHQLLLRMLTRTMQLLNSCTDILEYNYKNYQTI